MNFAAALLLYQIRCAAPKEFPPGRADYWSYFGHFLLCFATRLINQTWITVNTGLDVWFYCPCVLLFCIYEKVYYKFTPTHTHAGTQGPTGWWMGSWQRLISREWRGQNYNSVGFAIALLLRQRSMSGCWDEGKVINDLNLSQCLFISMKPALVSLTHSTVLPTFPPETHFAFHSLAYHPLAPPHSNWRD